MQYMSEFCVAAVIGTVVLFALYFLKRNYDTPHNRLFFYRRRLRGFFRVLFLFL